MKLKAATQLETPLFDTLLKHVDTNPIAFHIPGHKGGKGMDPAFRDFIGENALKIDLINIAPLDDLHHPKAAIAEAERLAADAFRADETFFSVQGTSSAIMAMIMGVVGPNEKIIVPRNVHKSVMSALVLTGAHPVFIHPEFDETYGIAHGITASAVERALELHPDTKAVLVINPTYFGVAGDLERIVAVAHAQDVPVLVDEAHGVHLPFHDELPLSAMQAGADVAATSVHKLGGSMTGSSILNVRRGLVSPERIHAMLSMITTTSTSYLLLASLDAARRQLATKGEAMNNRALSLARTARSAINNMPHLSVYGHAELHSESTYALDETKVLVSVRELGITGFEIEKYLREKHQIEVEMSDLLNVLFIVTSADDESTIQALIDAMRDVVSVYNTSDNDSLSIMLPEIPPLALSPRDAFYEETETIPLENAVGRISAEFIMVYPPGIPIIIPGELITASTLEYIVANIEAGLPVQGLEDESLQMIKVIQQTKAIR